MRCSWRIWMRLSRQRKWRPSSSRSGPTANCVRGSCQRIHHPRKRGHHTVVRVGKRNALRTGPTQPSGRMRLPLRRHPVPPRRRTLVTAHPSRGTKHHLPPKNAGPSPDTHQCGDRGRTANACAACPTRPNRSPSPSPPRDPPKTSQ